MANKPPTFLRKWKPGQSTINAEDWNSLIDFASNLYHATVYRGRNAPSWNPWVKIYNGSGVSIPAFSMVEITSYDEDTDTYTVNKPTGMNLDHTLVTWDTAIPSTGYGEAHPYGPVKVKVDDDGEGEAVVGGYVGSQTGDFEPLLFNYGWLIVGDLTSGATVYAQVVKRNVFAIWEDDGE